MTVLDETLNNAQVEVTGKQDSEGKESVISGFITLISSVRFGIILLILLLTASFVGMLVMQQNVQGFERYYAELTPSQRIVYGYLGLFDIYHAWYFNALLGLLSLNIILASIDRFPKTWKFVSSPKLVASAKWLEAQKPSDSITIEGEKDKVVEDVVNAYRTAGWRRAVVTVKGNTTTVFAESGVWNRLGAYPVHVALLTIFLGGFLTAQLGYTGQMPLSPGQSSNQISETVFELDQIKDVNKNLPFKVICTDLEQKLIKNDGNIEAGNTIDWLTHIQIKDEFGTREGVVQMNRPLDYRGYRFFQASFMPIGKARNITIRLSSETGETQDVSIKRDGTATLQDGTNIRFVDFRANFSLAKEDPNENSTSYQTPAAILEIIPPNGSAQTAYAFGKEMKGIPIAGKPIGGYTFELVNFEKVAEQHVLSVQRDPGATVVYIGFTLLILTLVAVFFFSHQRVWAVIEEVADGQFKLTAGGDTNRNQTAFEEKFGRFVNGLRTGKI